MPFGDGYMSNEHAIDLCERSQEDFKNLLLNLNKKSSYWCVFDKNCHILEMSDVLPECFFLPKKNEQCFLFKSDVIFLQDEVKSVFKPYEINFDSFFIDDDEYCAMFLTLNNENYLDLILMDLNNFYYKDNLGNELTIEYAIELLRDVNPFDKISQKDWLIAWLVIHEFTTERISIYLKQKPNSINIAIKRLLGVKKLELFDRDLFKKVARLLGWYNYVPASLIYKNTIKTTVYKNMPLNGTDTVKIFTYSHSNFNL